MSKTYKVAVLPGDGIGPEVMAEAARMAADIGASSVDINMGCPARKVTAGMCGSALMRELPRALSWRCESPSTARS